MPGRFVDDDDDDPFHDVSGGEKYYDEEDDDDEVEVDTDMLPTLLVYRDGQLVHNWVRVDWEAGQAGVEDLLARYDVIHLPSLPSNVDIGITSYLVRRGASLRMTQMMI